MIDIIFKKREELVGWKIPSYKKTDALPSHTALELRFVFALP